MIDIPGLQFDLGEDVQMLRETLRAFVAREITPRAAEIDRSDCFPMDLWAKFGELGVLGLTVSESYGGTDLGYLAHVVAMEEISRGSASVGLSYGAHSNLCVNQIFRNGTPAQRERYLPGLIAGRLIGGPLLAPRISPKKTWAGLGGAVASSACVGLVVSALDGQAPPALLLAAAGAVLAVVAQAGDLAESAFKRHFGAKDASGLIPGHGGMMDRVDGLVAAAACLAVFQWASAGAVLAWR